MHKIKSIGVLTSGGDAPGMNAAIRAVVRTALKNNIKVYGIKRGYDGLINEDYEELTSRSVSEIIHTGGTILLSARCKEMMTIEGQKKAKETCDKLGINALVVIGGDGSLKGAVALSKLGLKVVGVPGTIDLDLPCSDYTIGFDTAVNTGMEAINKIINTSFSHERCTIVEVMGRNCGAIALWTGLTCGAEEILIPEQKEITKENLIELIIANKNKGKKTSVIIVAEGIGNSQQLAKDIEKITGIETRATILGHLQRGGSPTAIDRVHASFMGSIAVKTLLDDKTNRIIVYKNAQYIDLDITEALNYNSEYNDNLYNLSKQLS